MRVVMTFVYSFRAFLICSTRQYSLPLEKNVEEQHWRQMHHPLESAGNESIAKIVKRRLLPHSEISWLVARRCAWTVTYIIPTQFETPKLTRVGSSVGFLFEPKQVTLCLHNQNTTSHSKQGHCGAKRTFFRVCSLPGERSKINIDRSTSEKCQTSPLDLCWQLTACFRPDGFAVISRELFRPLVKRSLSVLETI